MRRVSAAILSVEKAALIVLAGLITGLILVNVATRSIDQSIYWIDELAIYAMIWLVMIGASAMVRMRKGIAVTLAETFLSARATRALKVFVDAVVALFSLALIVLCWVWFQPWHLINAGFDIQAFSSSTFNFIYQEPTNTIGIPKFYVWLIMPVAAFTMAVHAVANLLESVAGQADTIGEGV